MTALRNLAWLVVPTVDAYVIVLLLAPQAGMKTASPKSSLVCGQESSTPSVRRAGSTSLESGGVVLPPISEEASLPKSAEWTTIENGAEGGNGFQAGAAYRNN